MMFAPVRVEPPAETPVSLDEVKDHLRVVHSDDDKMISALIESATSYLDGWAGILGRALVTQTWRVDFGIWPVCQTFRLPLAPPIQSVSVAYWDGANANQTWDVAAYSLHENEIVLASGTSWPSLYSRVDAARVTFVAGYGDAEDVPEAIKSAMKLHIEQIYDGYDAARQVAIDALLSPFRLVRF